MGSSESGVPCVNWVDGHFVGDHESTPSVAHGISVDLTSLNDTLNFPLCETKRHMYMLITRGALNSADSRTTLITSDCFSFMVKGCLRGFILDHARDSLLDLLV